ncbi:hypothetical protein CDD81_747 [Ophiocordyceps australis]|uniref:L-type lectin-like domain-containing protein n=1 Tax=Ophiocordyceps australis TaxID=1399860 RepID=A0A2C5Y150_9HYPO|nr:hypothetical protein CDD81_747 [Ophiocordyceps australis]
MRPWRVPAALAALLVAHDCHATPVMNEISFGHAGRLSPVESPGKIPHFSIYGHPQLPEVLSNKIILTPIAPGNQHSAIWADVPLERTSWTTDVEFRTNGPERTGHEGGGSLALWLVRDGAPAVATNSIYTVGRFEGLALVIDAHGPSGGMIRGFLNDGTQHYAALSQQQAQQQPGEGVDKLAFGHCPHAYRNLGRPSHLRLRQTHNSFRVDIDGQLCFETDKVSLPAGYHFGMTAATPDSPDSFEVFELSVTSDSMVSGNTGGKIEYATLHDQPKQHQDQQGQTQHAPPKPAGMADESADKFTTSQTQFTDLHNRLQSATHQIQAIYDTVKQLEQSGAQRSTELRQAEEQRFADLRKTFDSLSNRILAVIEGETDRLERVKRLEAEVRGMRSDINNKLSSHHDSLQSYLGHHHASLAEAVTSSMPSHGLLIAVVAGSQLILVVAYIVYKRRRANSPKKFL